MSIPDPPRPNDVGCERTEAEVRGNRQHKPQAARYNQLIEAVSALLFRVDPVDINFERNTDEYDTEAITIVDALPTATNLDDVTALTHDTFVEWFGSETAGTIDRYTDVARDIWNLWRRHQEQGVTGR